MPDDLPRRRQGIDEVLLGSRYVRPEGEQYVSAPESSTAIGRFARQISPYRAIPRGLGYMVDEGAQAYRNAQKGEYLDAAMSAFDATMGLPNAIVRDPILAATGNKKLAEDALIPLWLLQGGKELTRSALKSMARPNAGLTDRAARQAGRTIGYPIYGAATVLPMAESSIPEGDGSEMNRARYKAFGELPPLGSFSGDDVVARHADGGEVEDKFSDMRQTIRHRPLDFRKLIDAGAVRIAYGGNGKDGGYSDTERDDNYSLVTLHNDRAKDSYTKNWPDKPQSVERAISELNEPGALYDGKYNQILWSAKERGLDDEEIFRDEYAKGGKVDRLMYWERIPLGQWRNSDQQDVRDYIDTELLAPTRDKPTLRRPGHGLDPLGESRLDAWREWNGYDDGGEVEDAYEGEYEEGGEPPVDEETLTEVIDWLAAQGRNGDDRIAHINAREAAILRALGGKGAANPYTGLEAYEDGGDDDGGDDDGGDDDDDDDDDDDAGAEGDDAGDDAGDGGDGDDDGAGAEGAEGDESAEGSNADQGGMSSGEAAAAGLGELSDAGIGDDNGPAGYSGAAGASESDVGIGDDNGPAGAFGGDLGGFSGFGGWGGPADADGAPGENEMGSYGGLADSGLGSYAGLGDLSGVAGSFSGLGDLGSMLSDYDAAMSGNPMASAAPTSDAPSSLAPESFSFSPSDLTSVVFDPSPVSEQNFALSAPYSDASALADMTLSPNAITSEFNTVTSPSMPTDSFNYAQSGVVNDLGLQSAPNVSTVDTELRNENNPLNDVDWAAQLGIPGLTIGPGFTTSTAYGTPAPDPWADVQVVQQSSLPQSVQEALQQQDQAMGAQNAAQSAPQSAASAIDEALSSVASAAPANQSETQDRAEQTAAPQSLSLAQLASSLNPVSAAYANDMFSPPLTPNDPRILTISRAERPEGDRSSGGRGSRDDGVDIDSVPAGSANAVDASKQAGPQQAVSIPGTAWSASQAIQQAQQLRSVLGDTSATFSQQPTFKPGGSFVGQVSEAGSLAPLTSDQTPTALPTAAPTQDDAPVVNPRARYADRTAPQSEVDWLAHAMIGEARGEGREGMLAVAQNVNNRANTNFNRFGNTVADQVQARSQYSYLNDSNRAVADRAMAQNSPQWQRAQQLARAVLEGRVADPTLGAVMYHNPAITRGNPASTAHRAAEARGMVDIGEHRFSDFRNAPNSAVPGFFRGERQGVPTPPARPVELDADLPALGAADMSKFTERADPNAPMMPQLAPVQVPGPNGPITVGVEARPSPFGTLPSDVAPMAQFSLTPFGSLAPLGAPLAAAPMMTQAPMQPGPVGSLSGLPTLAANPGPYPDNSVRGFANPNDPNDPYTIGIPASGAPVGAPTGVVGPQGSPLSPNSTATGQPAPGPAAFNPNARELTVPSSRPAAPYSREMDENQIGDSKPAPFSPLHSISLPDMVIGTTPLGPINTITKLVTGKSIPNHLRELLGLPEGRPAEPGEFPVQENAGGESEPRRLSQTSPYSYSPPTGSSVGASNPAWSRTYVPPTGDLRRYGMTSGEHTFFTDNRALA